MMVGKAVSGKMMVAVDKDIYKSKTFFPPKSVTVTVLIFSAVTTFAFSVVLPSVKDSPLTGVFVSLPPSPPPPQVMRKKAVKIANKTFKTDLILFIQSPFKHALK